MFKAYRDIGLAVIAAKGDDLGGVNTYARHCICAIYLISNRDVS